MASLILTTTFLILGFASGIWSQEKDNAAKTSLSNVINGFSTAPPTLNVYQEEMTIVAGRVLQIQCLGERHLNWTLPYKAKPPLLERASFNETSVIQQDGRMWYTNILTVTETLYMDTGYYICSYADEVPVKYTASVYIFVKDVDGNIFLSVDSTIGNGKFVWMPIHQGRLATIPCRVNDPKANVTFIKAGQVLEFGENLLYDPKVGIQIPYPNPVFGGQYSCRAATENYTDTFTAILNYQQSTTPPQPVLTTNIGEHGNILKMEELRIKCHTLVQRGVTSQINFDYPVQSDRVVISLVKSSPVEYNGYEYDKIERSITVSDIQVEDSGVYQCTIKNHDNKSNHRAVSVYVHEESFIWLKSETQVESFAGSSYIDLSVSIQAYDEPSCLWLKDNHPIPETDRRYEIKTRADRSRLRIYNVLLSDAGLYTLKATNRDRVATENITLTVLLMPSVELQVPDNHPFYIAGTLYTLICVFGGSPFPTLRWSWQPCLKPGCQPEEDGWMSVTQSKNIPNMDDDNPGLLHLQAEESGFYHCTAENKVGTNISQPAHFIVTDIAGGFGHYLKDTDFQGEQISPLVGDTVSIVCQASQYAFMPPQFYLEIPNSEAIRLINTTGIIITEQLGHYGNLITMTLTDVDKNDEGWYHCKTHDFRGEVFTSFFSIKTRVPTLPVFVKPLDGMIQVLHGTDYTLECIADGDPEPSMLWYKDKVQLTEAGESINERYSFYNDYTRLEITNCEESDSGYYTCEAVNRLGSMTSNMTISVVASLEIRDDENKLSKAQIGMIVGILLGALLLVIIGVLISRRFSKRKYAPILLEDYLQPSASVKYNPDLPLDEQTDCLAYDPQWEIPKENLRFDIVLGQGAFGKVMRADMKCKDPNSTPQVAVKMVRDVGDREQLKALLSELKVLIHIGQHLNLVNLVGAVTTQLEQGHLYVVVEYCRYGSLRHYMTKKRDHFIDTMDDTVKMNALAKAREAEGDFIPPPSDCDYLKQRFNTSGETSASGYSRKPLLRNYKLQGSYSGASVDYPSMMSDATSAPTTVTYLQSDGHTGASAMSGLSFASQFSYDDEVPLITKDLVSYSYQIARGMEYLTSRKYIHRDLAARNILLADDNVVKICDFGLAKDCYKYNEYKKKSDAPVPVKWMALESLTHKVYTTKSDVWSYGILLWELFTIGGTPYPAVDLDETFVQRLRGGYRLEKPKYASEPIYEIMMKCWANDPADRPTFTELAESIGNLLQDSVKQFYMELSTLYTKIQPGEAYINMRGSEYLPMDTDDDSDQYPVAKANPKSGQVHYLNEKIVRPNSEGDTEQDNLMSTNKVDVINECEDPNKTKTHGVSPDDKVIKSPKSNALDKPRTAQLRKANEDGSGDVSVKSGASSGFHSDYGHDDVAVPPHYSMVVNETEVSQL